LWAHTFGGSGSDYISSIEEDLDDGYLISGSTSSCGAGSSDGLNLKFDQSGSIQWAYTSGDTAQESSCGLFPSNDGGYHAGGSSMSYGEGDQDYYVLQTDGSFQISNCGFISPCVPLTSNVTSVISYGPVTPTVTTPALTETDLTTVITITSPILIEYDICLFEPTVTPTPTTTPTPPGLVPSMNTNGIAVTIFLFSIVIFVCIKRD
ncbi:hypothetical protein K8T06_14200, partial [bacterium]|nr:hypothetical protein [bacterium]